MTEAPLDNILEKIMARDDSKQGKDVDQQQGKKDDAPELTDQELAKVSGGAIKRAGARRPVRGRGGDDDLEDLEVER